MRVAHLMSTAMTNHGPSDGIRIQLAAQGSHVHSAEVWSMYPPPPERDPTDAFHRIGVTHRVLPAGRSFVDPRAAGAVRRALSVLRPDILQTHLVRANLWGRLAGRLHGGTPVICTLRGVEDYFKDPGLTAALVRQVESMSHGMVARYVAVSDGVRDAAISYLRLPESLVVTIRNAVDLSPFAVPADRARARALLGISEESILVGSVSVFEPRKNVSLLLSAFAAARQRHPALDLQLVLVGDGDGRPALEAQVARDGLVDAVHFAGFRRDIASLLSGFDVFALTSLGEGLPRAVMEAMAAGVPCVVTDVGGNREAVAHGIDGFVHAVSDVEGLVESLSRLCADDDMRRAFSTAARAAAFSRFHPDRLAREYDALYAQVMAEQRHASGGAR